MLNRPVRTRMPGGVGGGIREDSPYPDYTFILYQDYPKAYGSGESSRRRRTGSSLTGAISS